MNTPPTMNQGSAKWYYMGQDEQEHGPFESPKMIQWSKSGYFNDMLLVRTENDPKYFPLVEWTRLCGNQLPFHFSIFSMDSLVMERVNAINLANQMPPPPPPAPTAPTPRSAPIFAPPPAPVMVSAAFPPPPPNVPMFSPNQQFLYTSTVPPPFPLVQNGMYMNMGHPELENPSSTVSNTPESEPLTVDMIPTHREQATDGSDMPWLKRRYVERGTSPIRLLNIQDHKGTQTSPIKVPASNVSRLLSEMMNMPIQVVGDSVKDNSQNNK